MEYKEIALQLTLKALELNKVPVKMQNPRIDDEEIQNEIKSQTRIIADFYNSLLKELTN